VGGLEGGHLLQAAEGMVLEGAVLFLQQPDRPQPPGAGMVGQIHAVKA
jgi:hypothetical protein